MAPPRGDALIQSIKEVVGLRLHRCVETVAHGLRMYGADPILAF